MKKYSIFFFLLILTIIITTQPIYSQDQASLGYSPTSEYFNLQPGEVYEDFFNVWNLSEETITYYVYISGFAQIEDFPGTSIPLSPEDDSKDPYSASSWLNLDYNEIQIDPYSDVDINYIIKVPNNVALGEYTAKIFLSTNKEFDYESQSGTIANLASGPNFLIQVGDPDQLSEEMDLLKFTSDKSFYEKTPVTFITEIENTGNTHVTPKGDIVVYNLYNKEVARFPLNGADASTLRGQTSKYRTEWSSSRQILNTENQLIIGPMRAELIATYKSENPGFYPILSETKFWIIPWKLILAIIVAIILISMGLKVRKKGSKKKSDA